jgi:tetratricopeptide (TPR) repeat protein
MKLRRSITLLITVVLGLQLVIGCGKSPQETGDFSYAQALKQKEILKKDPDNYDALIELGKNYTALSKSERLNGFTQLKYKWLAEKAFEKAIRINPEDYRVYYERAMLGVGVWAVMKPAAKRVPKRNWKDIDQAISLSPNNPDCYLQKTHLLLLSGKFEEAAETYEKTISLMTQGKEKLRGGSSLKVNIHRFQLINLYLFGLEDKTNALRLLEDIYEEGLQDEAEFMMFVEAYKVFPEPKGQWLEEKYNSILSEKRYQHFVVKFGDLIKAPPLAERTLVDPRDVYKRLRA